jgi:hypothetical protein
VVTEVAKPQHVAETISQRRVLIHQRALAMAAAARRPTASGLSSRGMPYGGCANGGTMGLYADGGGLYDDDDDDSVLGAAGRA